MNTEVTVTGQLEVPNDSDLFPSVGKGHEVVSVSESAAIGPNVVRSELRPERNWQAFKVGAGFDAVKPIYLRGDDLHGEMPHCERANVHLEVVAEGELEIRVAGEETPTVPSSG